MTLAHPGSVPAARPGPRASSRPLRASRRRHRPAHPPRRPRPSRLSNLADLADGLLTSALGLAPLIALALAMRPPAV